MMERPLQILHLEDDPNDAELVRTALAAGGLRCTVELVSTRATFLQALERGGTELVLSDFPLPGFDGFAALALVRERVPELPFLFVSGTLGEDAAIESLQRGATDYVLKQRLSRLAPSVRRALEEAGERRKRREFETKLQQERRFLKAVLESLEAGVVACDSAGVLTLFNRAAREFHGLPEEPLPLERWAERYRLYEADGSTLMPSEALPLSRALAGERFRNVELMIAPKSGPARTVLASGQPIVGADGRNLGAVVAMHDITERKQLEAQLRHAQKMEAIGQLAGGVAHDFNNLLNVIMGNCELALTELTPEGRLRDRVLQVQTAAERSASLTRQLLAFSRKQVIEPRVLDLNKVLVELEKMLRRLIGEDIEFITVQGQDLGRVKADPGQVEQIVMNLVVNARDAMPGGGTLCLETANADLDEQGAQLHPGARPGPYVMFRVSDTGVGMDAAVQSRIFEPFFTTKAEGKGTGLGLATVYGIVKQHDGHILVESMTGAGTTIAIYLPRVEQPVQAADSQEETLSPHGTETVLVVEDEEAIRDVIRESLDGYGYTVLEAGDAGEALEICQQHDGPIHLLMTDVVLPNVSGRELSRRVTELRRDLSVLYMSGYSDDTIAHHGLLDRSVAFLQKPFALTVMARKVRQVLDAGAQPPGSRRPPRTSR